MWTSPCVAESSRPLVCGYRERPYDRRQHFVEEEASEPAVERQESAGPSQHAPEYSPGAIAAASAPRRDLLVVIRKDYDGEEDDVRMQRIRGVDHFFGLPESAPYDSYIVHELQYTGDACMHGNRRPTYELLQVRDPPSASQVQCMASLPTHSTHRCASGHASAHRIPNPNQDPAVCR